MNEEWIRSIGISAAIWAVAFWALLTQFDIPFIGVLFIMMLPAIFLVAIVAYLFRTR